MRQGHAQGAHLEARQIRLGHIAGVFFKESAATVYDLHVRPHLNYVVTRNNYIVHNSGKTHNGTAAALIFANETGKSLDLVRSTNTALKGSIYAEDILPIARQLGLYDEWRHNKTDQLFYIGALNARIRYFGADNDQKLRGWKRDVLLMNEANEFSNEARRQLWMRTSCTRIIEHNPTIDDEHWIIKLLEPLVASGECVYFHSTYLDNLPFLSDALVKAIESMQFDDPYGWQIYGLGLRGSHPAAVFDDVTLGAFDPVSDTVYSVDFGTKSPYVVAEWGWRDSNPPIRPRPTLYCRPLVHAVNLLTEDVIVILDELEADKDKEMVCDSAEPDNVRRLRMAGYNARSVKKSRGEGQQGFRITRYKWLKRHCIIVDAESPNAQLTKNELKRTRHKLMPGTDKYTDEVVKDDDHVADTGAYGAYDSFAGMQPVVNAGALVSDRSSNSPSPFASLR